MLKEYEERANKINILACNSTDGKLPDSLCLPEQQLFVTLYYMYKLYRAGRLEKSDAEKNKQDLFTQYGQYQLYYDGNMKSCKQICKMDEMISKCTKNKDNCECCKAISEFYDVED